MTSFTEHDIALFLQNNPDFFANHADVFSHLQVPHPQGERAISLGERQILLLRERNRELEWRLKELACNATANEGISDALVQWSCQLLSEADPLHLPGEIALGVAEKFNLDQVALRLWNLPQLPPHGYGETVSEDIRTFTDSLKTPYCGQDTEFEAVRWLTVTPQSLVLVPLRLSATDPSVGLLLLGSNDPERFHPEMGTTFLEAIGRLASAALHRLAGAGASN
jgi:hypothetical protein